MKPVRYKIPKNKLLFSIDKKKFWGCGQKNNLVRWAHFQFLARQGHLRTARNGSVAARRNPWLLSDGVPLLPQKSFGDEWWLINTTIWMSLMPLECTIKNDFNGKLHVTCISPPFWYILLLNSQIPIFYSYCSMAESMNSQRESIF